MIDVIGNPNVQTVSPTSHCLRSIEYGISPNPRNLSSSILMIAKSEDGSVATTLAV